MLPLQLLSINIIKTKIEIIIKLNRNIKKNLQKMTKSQNTTEDEKVKIWLNTTHTHTKKKQFDININILK